MCNRDRTSVDESSLRRQEIHLVVPVVLLAVIAKAKYRHGIVHYQDHRLLRLLGTRTLLQPQHLTECSVLAHYERLADGQGKIY